MKKKTSSTDWFKILVVIVLILGVFFRFFNIGQKPYWFDETFTSLRISGYTELEVVKQVCNSQVLSVKDLQKYQQLGTERTLMDTIKSLALEDPQHPPLYFSIAHFWTYLFGNSVATIRSLSAIISLMVFPCLYWLCLELFDSSIVGFIGSCVFSVLI